MKMQLFFGFIKQTKLISSESVGMTGIIRATGCSESRQIVVSDCESDFYNLILKNSIAGCCTDDVQTGFQAFCIDVYVSR